MVRLNVLNTAGYYNWWWLNLPVSMIERNVLFDNHGAREFYQWLPNGLNYWYLEFETEEQMLLFLLKWS
jgi:hypothetical protein